MKVKVWNAFASNNSGSYTIVGSFPSCEIAEEVARELTEVLQSHSDWLSAKANWSRLPEAFEESPFSKFIKRHGLHPKENEGGIWTDCDDDIPQAFAIESKVIVHHDYTITMPREFGEFFYCKGGRVQQEINHAHNPVVAICELWVPWEERKEEELPGKISALLEILCAPGSTFLELSRGGRYGPAWRRGDEFGTAPLTIGAIFDDLCAGFTTVNQIAKEQGFKTSIKVFEAFDESDPLSFLRPSTPPLERKLKSLTLLEAGYAPTEVVNVLMQLLDVSYSDAREVLDSAPVVIFADALPERSEEAASLLKKAGASVQIS